MLGTDVIGLLLFAIAVALAAYLLLIGVVRVAQPVRHAAVRMAGAFSAPFSATFVDLDRGARLRRLEDELRGALGESDEWGDQERAEIVCAALAAQQINVLNQTLRKSVGQCLRTHWAVAEGSGATHMSEAARHPLSRHLRQRVMDVSDLLTTRLASYPLVLEAPELIRLQLGLRWIPATCATCPYWTASVANAPKICPTAKAVLRPARDRSADSVVDGEVVDQCVEGP